jgi:hypothetical protein
MNWRVPVTGLVSAACERLARPTGREEEPTAKPETHLKTEHFSLEGHGKSSVAESQASCSGGVPDEIWVLPPSLVLHGMCGGVGKELT